MIRINLLPYKESTLIQWGQRQVLLFVVAVLISGVICVVWAGRLPDPEKKKKELMRDRAKYEQKTREVQARKTCKRSSYNKKIKRANRKYRAIERLITKRRTPKYVLRELSRILSGSWGPTLKVSLAGRDRKGLFNPNWDTTSLYVTRFEEKGRQVKIEGGAKAMDDVAEFWRRLQVSAYFRSVDLEKIKKVRVAAKGGKASKEEHMTFSMVARVNY